MKSPLPLLFTLMFALPILAQEDHSELIESPFSSPQEATKTCLMCKDGLDQDIMKTWYWNGDCKQ